MKTAVVAVPHNDCEKSLQSMLEAVGYQVFRPGDGLLRAYNRFNRQPLLHRLPVHNTVNGIDLFVIIKHFYNYPLRKRFPTLNGKVLWFDINGGIPGSTLSKDQYKALPLRTPCPYLGANKHYQDSKCSGPRYVTYIPMVDRGRFECLRHKPEQSPVCLVHNVKHWGYGSLVQPLRNKVRFYGSHGSPAGLLPSTKVPQTLRKALCYVHVKGRDCPGYSLYQALLAACPVIVLDRFIERTGYSDLYEPGVTCLAVKDPWKLPPEKRFPKIVAGVEKAIEALKDPEYNQTIGLAGRQRLKELMWNPREDAETFKHFLEENYGPGTT